MGSKRAAATSFTLSRRRVYTLIIAAVGGFQQQQQQQHLRASAVPLVCARYLAVAAAPAALWLEMLKNMYYLRVKYFMKYFSIFVFFLKHF